MLHCAASSQRTRLMYAARNRVSSLQARQIKVREINLYCPEIVLVVVREVSELNPASATNGLGLRSNRSCS